MSRIYRMLGLTGSVLLLPITIMGYGAVFNYSYSNNQLSGAGILACVGVFVIFISCMIVDLSK